LKKQRFGFVYIAVLAVVAVLMILVYALDYQGRSSSAAARMAESRLYAELAAADYVGKKLTSVDLQYRDSVNWVDAELPITIKADENTNQPKWDSFRALDSWTPGSFPTLGTFPAEGETAESMGQTIPSPGTEDDDVVSYPGQTRAMLVPRSGMTGFQAPSSRYRMSLVKGFPFAAYAPNGDVTIEGSGLAWANPTEPQIDADHRTLDFYTGYPFRVGARGDIEIEDLPYGEAYSLEGEPLVKGGGIGFTGYLPYGNDDQGYAARLGERLDTLMPVLNAASYDKTDVIFGTLNVENILTAIFDPNNASFNNFLTYEQSTRWWFVLIPGFKSRGPALDITLHAPLKPDFGTYDSNDEVYEDEDDAAMTPELEKATDALAEVEDKLGSVLKSAKKADDPAGTQPLTVDEGDGKKSPDFQKFSEMVNDRYDAESKFDLAEKERDKKTGKEDDKDQDKIHETKAKEYDKAGQELLSKHGFSSLDQFDEWADRERDGSFTNEDGEVETFSDDYKGLLKDWEDAQKDFADAKNDASGMNESRPDVDEYDPGPTRTREKELVKANDLNKDGWKGTNLWTMVIKIAKVIANLVKDVGTAFFNHVFVKIKIFGITLYLPNPVKIITFFFADGEFKSQDIQGQPYTFQNDGVPDLVELALVTLKRALVQEVTLVYLGKDGGVGPAVPIRIGPDTALGYQKGDPEAERGSFSIHNSFTVPAGRTFKLLPKDGMAGMTIGADLWIQRGATMYIDGDLVMENPEPSLSTPHRPKGKIVMEPGSTLVVDGNLTGAGDPFMGSILLTRRAGRVEPITSAIICSGTVDLPHGIRNGFNLIQIAELISSDAADIVQTFFDDVASNLAKVLGPFHSRKPFFARNGATFTFYFPVIVPNPATSMLNKNLNVKLFAILSPLFAGSLNMTLGDNFITCSDWWMFGEDRLPVLPKVLPGPIEAALKEATVQGESMFNSGTAALTQMMDQDFFATQIGDLITGELGGMFGKIENFGNNIDKFIEDVAEETLTNYFTVENITTKLIEFLGKAALAALDPSGVAMIAFEEIQNQVMPASGDSFVEEMTSAAEEQLSTTYGFPLDGEDYLKGIAEDILEPFTGMAQALADEGNKRAMRVAATLMAAETPGILIYGDTIQVGGLYAAGMFVAKNDLTMDCAYTIGSMVSINGSISAQEVLYVPEFTRANVFESPDVVDTPGGSGIERLPEYWANALGFAFSNGGEVGKALNYGNGTGNGTWHAVPAPSDDTAFRVGGGWGH